MFDVIFYSDASGNEPVAEFIQELRQKSFTSKDARVNLNKIVAYIDLLMEIDQAKRLLADYLERNDE